MDLTAEKKESESNMNHNSEIADSPSQLAPDANNYCNEEAEERQARDLKAGLHPLKVLFLHCLIAQTLQSQIIITCTPSNLGQFLLKSQSMLLFLFHFPSANKKNAVHEMKRVVIDACFILIFNF